MKMQAIVSIIKNKKFKYLESSQIECTKENYSKKPEEFILELEKYLNDGWTLASDPAWTTNILITDEQGRIYPQNSPPNKIV